MVFLTRVVKKYGVGSFSITECQAACSLMMKVDIHVYQVVENSSDFIRISCFDSPNAVANFANSV